MAAISIHWAELAKVGEVSLAFGVGVVVVFALGILGVSRIESAPAGSPARAVGYLSAATAFLACAAAVAYGLYLMIPQFH